MIVYEVTAAARTFLIELERDDNPTESAAKNRSQSPSATRWRVHLDKQDIALDCVETGNGVLSLILNGQSFEARLEQTGDGLRVWLGGVAYDCSVRDLRSLRTRKRSGSGDSGAQEIKASMPGKVVRMLANVGENIAAGQGLLVIEAMKMQNEVRSPRSGLLKKVNAKEGVNVNAGEVLAIIE